MDSNCCSEPVSYAAVEEDGTSGLVIEVSDDLDKVGADVLLHGCPQSCMLNPVEGYPRISKDHRVLKDAYLQCFIHSLQSDSPSRLVAAAAAAV